MTKITPTAMCNTGWHNTGEIIRGYELWIRNVHACLYDRKNEHIVKMWKPKVERG